MVASALASEVDSLACSAAGTAEAAGMHARTAVAAEVGSMMAVHIGMAPCFADHKVMQRTET
jgi:hypothetical protein